MLRDLLKVLSLCLAVTAGSALAADDDAHFVQTDDFFIGDSQLGGHSYIYVSLAKMITAPKSATRDEGEFMKVRDGQTKWTPNIWQSRIAVPEELKFGQNVLMFHDNIVDNIYRAPKRKEQARGGAWWYARITDLTDTYKGYVTVSGNYKVALTAIRVPMPYTGAEAIQAAPPPKKAAPAPAPEPKPAPVAEAPAPEPDMPWTGGDWVEVRFGGCDTPDVKFSKVAVPDPDYCTPKMNGKVVICNADHGGCFYKNVTPKQCKDGRRPGRMFVCTPK